MTKLRNSNTVQDTRTISKEKCVKEIFSPTTLYISKMKVQEKDIMLLKNDSSLLVFYF